jgi:hypothetical protein
MPRIPATNENEIEDGLSPEDREKLIDELAQKIVKRGMETPAIMFLEMHKPVSFLASQTMLVASPFLAPIFGFEGVERYSRLFSTQENVELLIRRIEDLALQKDVERRRRKREQ